jgi:hypothetical protein
LPAVAARRDFAKDELIKTLSKTERPEVGKLARLRTKGVDLRNKGAAIVNEQQLGLWINEYEKWNKQMLSVARKYLRQWLIGLRRWTQCQLFLQLVHLSGLMVSIFVTLASGVKNFNGWTLL